MSQRNSWQLKETRFSWQSSGRSKPTKSHIHSSTTSKLLFCGPTRSFLLKVYSIKWGWNEGGNMSMENPSTGTYEEVRKWTRWRWGRQKGWKKNTVGWVLTILLGRLATSAKCSPETPGKRGTEPTNPIKSNSRFCEFRAYMW